MQKWPLHQNMLLQVGRVLSGGAMAAFRHVVMGLPLGWTRLEPLATHKFQEWRQRHFDA